MIICLLVSILTGCQSGEDPGPLVVAAPTQIQAPAFRLLNLRGEPVDLADSAGKVRVINFWATWCGPCRTEMPTLEALQEAMRDQPIEVLAVSVDENPAEVHSYIAEHGYSFPVLLDPRQQTAQRYGANMYPFSFVVDKQGRMVDQIAGVTDWASTDKLAYLRQLAAQ